MTRFNFGNKDAYDQFIEDYANGRIFDFKEYNLEFLVAVRARAMSNIKTLVIGIDSGQSSAEQNDHLSFNLSDYAQRARFPSSDLTLTDFALAAGNNELVTKFVSLGVKSKIVGDSPLENSNTHRALIPKISYGFNQAYIRAQDQGNLRLAACFEHFNSATSGLLEGEIFREVELVKAEKTKPARLKRLLGYVSSRKYALSSAATALSLGISSIFIPAAAIAGTFEGLAIAFGMFSIGSFNSAASLKKSFRKSDQDGREKNDATKLRDYIRRIDAISDEYLKTLKDVRENTIMQPKTPNKTVTFMSEEPKLSKKESMDVIDLFKEQRLG